MDGLSAATSKCAEGSRKGKQGRQPWRAGPDRRALRRDRAPTGAAAAPTPCATNGRAAACSAAVRSAWSAFRASKRSGQAPPDVRHAVHVAALKLPVRSSLRLPRLPYSCAPSCGRTGNPPRGWHGRSSLSSLPVLGRRRLSPPWRGPDQPRPPGERPRDRRRACPVRGADLSPASQVREGYYAAPFALAQSDQRTRLDRAATKRRLAKDSNAAIDAMVGRHRCARRAPSICAPTSGSPTIMAARSRMR